MPLVTPEDLIRLAGPDLAAEDVLDLRGLSLEAAEAELKFLLAAPRRTGLRVAILFDPARPGGGETLFQPIGRRLVAARRAGLIRDARPIQPGEVAGFLIELPDQAAAA